MVYADAVTSAMAETNAQVSNILTQKYCDVQVVPVVCLSLCVWPNVPPHALLQHFLY